MIHHIIMKIRNNLEFSYLNFHYLQIDFEIWSKLRLQNLNLMKLLDLNSVQQNLFLEW